MIFTVDRTSDSRHRGEPTSPCAAAVQQRAWITLRTPREYQDSIPSTARKIRPDDTDPDLLQYEIQTNVWTLSFTTLKEFCAFVQSLREEQGVIVTIPGKAEMWVGEHEIPVASHLEIYDD